MIMIPPIVVILIFVNPIIKIMLSSAFYPAASVLIVLTVYAFIISLTIPNSSLIVGINKPIIAFSAASAKFIIFIRL